MVWVGGGGGALTERERWCGNKDTRFDGGERRDEKGTPEQMLLEHKRQLLAPMLRSMEFMKEQGYEINVSTRNTK